MDPVSQNLPMLVENSRPARNYVHHAIDDRSPGGPYGLPAKLVDVSTLGRGKVCIHEVQLTSPASMAVAEP